MYWLFTQKSKIIRSLLHSQTVNRNRAELEAGLLREMIEQYRTANEVLVGRIVALRNEAGVNPPDLSKYRQILEVSVPITLKDRSYESYS